MRPHRDRRGDGPIRIFFIIGTLDIGGAETQLVELVTRLDRRRFEPTVCCLASAGPLAPRLEQAGVRVYALHLRAFRERGSYLRAMPHVCASVWRLFRALKSTRPHILHGVLFWAYVLGAFVGRAARVPTILASRRSLGLFKADKPAFLFLERLADRLTDLFIANSEAVREDTIARERIDPGRILVIHNGVDLGRFSVVNDDLSREPRPHVVVVSNLIHYKGHEYFLRAWPRIVARYPNATASLVGEGPMRPALEQLSRELGIEGSIRFVGSRQDVTSFLSAADLYVHPSLQEGYSNAILEAMAAGLPVVATRVGGNAEAVLDGETGTLVPPADAEALADGVLRILEDPARAARFGARAADVIRRRFDISAVVSAHEALYAKLVAGESVRYAPTEGVSRCAV